MLAELLVGVEVPERAESGRVGGRVMNFDVCVRLGECVYAIELDSFDHMYHVREGREEYQVGLLLSFHCVHHLLQCLI